jgi:uncharacterized protein YndB with AHSA1/START domain
MSAMDRRVAITYRKIIDGDFTHTITTWVSVPPEAAFDYVADFSRHAEWANDPMTIRSLDAMPVHVGSRFEASGRQGGHEWPSELVVTAFDRPHLLAFTATGGPIPTTEGHLHRHEFEFAVERAGTRLTVRRTDPIPNRAVQLLAPLITRFALRLRVRTIERLRERLEQLREPA